MGLVFFDGFEDGFAVTNGYGWAGNFDADDITSAFKRSGNYGARIDSGKTIYLPNTVMYKQVVFGFACRTINSAPVYIMINSMSNDRIFQYEMTSFMINQNTKAITVGTGFQIAVARASYDASSIDFTQWHYYELRCYYDGTNGVLEVYLDGTRIINWVGNTLAANANSTGFISHIRLNTQANVFDDLYVTASVTPSTANTEILGDVRVDRLIINGSGTFNDYVQDPNGNWTIVSDNNSSTFVTASGINIKETYSISPVPDINATIHGIKVGGAAQKTSIGNRTIKPIVYTSGTVIDSYPSVSLGYGGDTYFAGFYPTNPITSSRWTPNEIENIEVGTLVSGVL